MQILIRKLTFQAIVGILETEREVPQTIIIDIKIDYDYDGSIFINYAQICEFVQNDMLHVQYFLLEDALKSLTDKLKSNYPTINKISLKIFKPNILPNAIVGVKHRVIF